MTIHEQQDLRRLLVRWLRIALFLFFLTTLFPISELEAADLRGRIVDAETGEPLEGAVIVAVWYRRVYPCMHSCDAFYDAIEALSDDQGNFTVDLSTRWLASYRTVRIFKVGYRSRDLRDAIGEDKEIPDESLIRLMKLKSLEDQLRGDTAYFSICSPSPSRSCVPPEKIKNYVRLQEIHRKIRGD